MAGPPLIFSRVCLSLPSVFLFHVCLSKCLLVLTYLVHPPVPLLIPQLHSQGSHFIHPFVADPGIFVMPGLLTVSTTGTGQREAGGPRIQIKGSKG